MVGVGVKMGGVPVLVGVGEGVRVPVGVGVEVGVNVFVKVIVGSQVTQQPG